MEGACPTTERPVEHLDYVLCLGVVNALSVWPKMLQGEAGLGEAKYQ